MEAPLIDPRTYDGIVKRTAQLAGDFSGWRPAPDGQPDPGSALIGVFGRFAELVIERLNRSPDKHYLAFLNLIGASPLPPRPARVPLTFNLAAGSPVDAAVPAGSLAAAPPLAGEQDEVIFETERPLTLTRTQLRAVYVSDTEHDTYDDRFARAAGPSDEPFAVFTAGQPSPHQLYLACDPLLAQPGVKDVLVTLVSPDSWQWLNWPVTWAYWDGAGWRAITVSSEVRDGAWRVSLPALPELAPSPVDGIEACWLRAELAMPLPPGVSDQVPESVAIGARDPRNLTLPLSPFPADSPVKRFYLSADEAFAAGGAQVKMRVRLAEPGAGDVRLDWLYHAETGWVSLGKSGSAGQEGQPDQGNSEFSDGTLAFTREGEISFRVPMSWPRTLHRTRTGRWLRIDITDEAGQYTTPPVISELTVDTDWALPRAGDITVSSKQGAPSAPVPAPAAFANGSDIDLTMDFYPLGHQPQFNDTCYVACPDDLARPGAVITLSVTLANPPGSPQDPVPPVRTDGNPKIAWEVSDGSRWHSTDAAYLFTGNGEVLLTLPDPLGPGEVNGARGYWIRARLASGNYGKPASYEQNEDGTYTYTPATFAPPVIKTIEVTATAPAQRPAPVSACLSYNDFRYIRHDHENSLFPPFTPTADDRPALYLGFDQVFGPHPVTLFLEVEPPLPEQVAAEHLTGSEAATSVLITWEYSSQDGWEPLGAVDETRGLSDRGLVTFPGPGDLVSRQRFGRALHWLRLRWQTGTFPLPPRLRRVLLNTTWAAQVTTVTDEILGSGTGDPGQAFTAAHTPVQPGQQVSVREPRAPVPAEEQAIADVEGADAISVILDAAGQPEEIWVRWHAVPDFYQSGPRDRHYTADPESGVIRFGDGTSAMIPPIGQNNIRMTYRVGGGQQGNRPSSTIVELKSGIPYIEGVTNNQPSQGGAPAEPMNRVKARGPRVLRHRDRAIAAQDLEDLALAASANVATATAIVPIFNPNSLWLDPDHPIPTPAHEEVKAGRMGVVIVPDEPGSGRPTPSLVLLGQVRDYLLDRCPPTAELWVSGPEWIAISVRATVAVTSVDEAGQAIDRARMALERYLHPLTGGRAGQGWALGTWPHASDLSALLETVPGVDYVDGLTMTYQPRTPDERRELELKRILERPLTEPPEPPELQRDLVEWLARALVYSGPHDVSVVFGVSTRATAVTSGP
ncbi:MAG TPA: putative baseplate assembly protein [Streptosporangiaceae bacterium]